MQTKLGISIKFKPNDFINIFMHVNFNFSVICFELYCILFWNMFIIERQDLEVPMKKTFIQKIVLIFENLLNKNL